MTDVPPNAPPTVETIGLSKRFGSVKALDNASVRFAAGRLHALLGENGAGKSTLVKCMLGYYRADAGSILVDGRQRAIAKPQDAHALGLGMVYQHFTLVQQMTVAENLVLARAQTPLVIDWKAEHEALGAFMRRMPFELDPEYPVSSLAAGEKQKLEILKQLYLGRRFLVLDEPTSVLTPDESDEVLGEMRRLTDAGELSVVLITHKFREVLGHAQDVTVLRGGQVVGTHRMEETTQDALSELMFGSAAAESTLPPRRDIAAGPDADSWPLRSLGKTMNAIAINPTVMNVIPSPRSGGGTSEYFIFSRTPARAAIAAPNTIRNVEPAITPAMTMTAAAIDA